jgi:hypothetical protein
MTEPEVAAPASSTPAATRLELDVDLVPEQTTDDTDTGWGTEGRADTDPATVLRRYLDEKPPHHGD